MKLTELFTGAHEFEAALSDFRLQDSNAAWIINDVLNKNFGSEVLHQEGWRNFPPLDASIPADRIPGMAASEHPSHEVHDVIPASGIAVVGEAVENREELRPTTEAEQHTYANVLGFSPRGGHLAVGAVVDPAAMRTEQSNDLGMVA